MARTVVHPVSLLGEENAVAAVDSNEGDCYEARWSWYYKTSTYLIYQTCNICRRRDMIVRTGDWFEFVYELEEVDYHEILCPVCAKWAVEVLNVGRRKTTAEPGE
jgi:hypothetical protein